MPGSGSVWIDGRLPAPGGTAVGRWRGEASEMPTDVSQRGASIVALETAQTEPEPEKDPAV